VSVGLSKFILFPSFTDYNFGRLFFTSDSFNLSSIIYSLFLFSFSSSSSSSTLFLRRRQITNNIKQQQRRQARIGSKITNRRLVLLPLLSFPEELTKYAEQRTVSPEREQLLQPAPARL